MLKKLASHSLIYGLGPYATKLITIFLSPIISVYYTKEDYGVWGTIQAYTGFVTSLSILGMSFAFNYTFFRYKNRYSWKWRQYYGFLLLWNLIYSLVVGTVVVYFMPESVISNRLLIVILMVLPVLIMGPAGQIGPIYFQIRQKPQPVAVITILSSLLSVAVTYYTIVILKLGYLGFIWSFSTSAIFCNILYSYQLNKANMKPIFNFKKRTLYGGLKLSLPNIPHFYSYFLLGGVDKVIMDRSQVDVGSIGIYNQGVAMSGHVGAAVGAVHTALGVMLYDLLAKKAYLEIKSLIWKVQILFWAGTVFISLWMKEIFQFLIKNDTVVAYPIAVILILAFNHKPLYILASAELGYNGKVMNVWKATLLSGIIAFLLNLICIPIFGYKAVAFVMFFAWQIFGIGLFFLKDYRENFKVKINYFFIFSINFLLLGVVFLIDLDIFVKLFISISLLVFGSIFGWKFLINKIR